MTFDPAALETAITHIEALPDAHARGAAREAVRLLLELHREGLQSLTDRLKAHADGQRALADAAADPVLASVLLIHGISVEGADRHSPSGLLNIGARNRNAELGGTASQQGLSLEGAPLGASSAHANRSSRDRDLVPIARLTSRREHERCGLCAAGLGTDHPHAIDVERRKLDCVCEACLLLLERPGSKLRRVQRHARKVELHLEEPGWCALEVPVGLAFFSRASAIGEVVAT